MNQNNPLDVETRVDARQLEARKRLSQRLLDVETNVDDVSEQAKGAAMAKSGAESVADNAATNQARAKDVIKNVAAVGAVGVAAGGGYAFGATPTPATQAVEENQEFASGAEDAADDFNSSAQLFQDAESIGPTGDTADDFNSSAPFQDAESLGSAGGYDEAVGGLFQNLVGDIAGPAGSDFNNQAPPETQAVDIEEGAQPSASGPGNAAAGFDPSNAPHATTVTDDMSFDQAFATARRELGGGGGVFSWNGNSYHTYTREEWEVITGPEREPIIDGEHEGAEAVVADGSEGVVDGEVNEALVDDGSESVAGGGVNEALVAEVIEGLEALEVLEALVSDGSEGVAGGEATEALVVEVIEGLEALEGLVQNLAGDGQDSGIADPGPSVEPVGGDFNNQADINDW